MTPSSTPPLSPAGQRLATLLNGTDVPHPAPVRPFHVASIGRTFYFAYEQLRNATEYREHHLLLRGAIGRFLVREARLQQYKPIAADLVTDLTQAGYLQNDTIGLETLQAIDSAMRGYAAYYSSLQQLGTGLPADTIAVWLLQIASVHIEQLLAPTPRQTALMRFTYDHYLLSIEADNFDRTADDPEYQLAVYCAMQRALFKSDLPTTRYYWTTVHLSQAQLESPTEFIRFNLAIDALYQSPLTNRIERLINHYGAPMRILREVVLEDAHPAQLLANRDTTLSKARTICRNQYASVHQRLRSRIIKAIIFILLTKVLLGLAVEVPYDLARHDGIAWLPLLINILLPATYMALLGFSIAEPGPENTTIIANYLDRILYETDEGPVRYRIKKRVTSSNLTRTFSVIYAFGFIGSLTLVGWLLYKLGFNIVNGIIFVIFFSAVSFLGFRLRQTARELAMLDERQSLFRTVSDFLSTPFVRMGHWLSDRYARINLITRLLDVAIEMPLKTTLRLVQQWIGFMRDKQEEI